MTETAYESRRDPKAVRAMFERIAGRYDVLNTILSAGLDAWWRRQASETANLAAGSLALDVACGTGKLTAELHRLATPGGATVGLDFSPRMLAIASRRYPQISFVEGSALALPFGDTVFDVATMAFGLRNLADPLQALREIRRVLKPGGRAVVLEFLRPPTNLFGAAYSLYLRRLLPALGGLVSGDPAAYRYLSQTISSYQTADELVRLAQEAGWAQPRAERLTFATVGILSGSRE